jgi:hypothetical protein
MKEPDVRCYHLLLDQQPMSEQPQDWRHTPSQPEASTLEESAARDDDNACGVGVRRSLTTKVLFPETYPLVQFFRFAIAIVPVCRSRFRLAHHHERTTRQ